MEKRSSEAILKQLLINVENMLRESKKNNAANVKSMYGIFLENNKFIICKEEKVYDSECLELYEYFTHERVGHSSIVDNKISCNWHNGGKIYLVGINEIQVGFCVPLNELLNNYFVIGLTIEGKINSLYANVNKYIRENPNFVKQLFNSDNEKNKMI